MSFAPQSMLPFDRSELLHRQARLRSELRTRGVDAMLVFAQESLYWLTGYDSGGFVFFQCALVTADDRPIVLLTRRPDLLQARMTSIIEDVRIWWDADDANPAADLKVILEEHGLKGSRVAILTNAGGPARLQPRSAAAGSATTGANKALRSGRKCHLSPPGRGC